MVYLLPITLSMLIIQVLGHSHCSQHHHHVDYTHDDKIYAVAILRPDNNSGVHGIVKIIQDGDFTTIYAKIHGLQDGLHGFHIHEFGNLIKGCISAGPHYNPHSQNHGGPHHSIRHIGDLGNVNSKDKIAYFTLQDKLVRLSGEYSVIGRSMVVHANEDDLGQTKHPDSLTTGNAGPRLACGVIGLSGPFDLEDAE